MPVGVVFDYPPLAPIRAVVAEFARGRVYAAWRAARPNWEQEVRYFSVPSNQRVMPGKGGGRAFQAGHLIAHTSEAEAWMPD